MKEYKSCLIKNQCIKENNIEHSWMYDALKKSRTCMSLNCRPIILQFLCCSLKDSNEDVHSVLNSIPLNCPSLNAVSMVEIVTLGVFIVTSGVSCLIGLFFGLIFYIKIKTKNNYNEIE
jgi:hypothetical protein